MRVCFTGHRISTLEKYDILSVKNALEKVISGLVCDEGANSYISGMALGTDIFAAQCVLSLKASGTDVKLECAVPCKTQTLHWSAADKRTYNDILSKADKVTVLYDSYNRWCMFERNRYMVDNSDIVVAVYDGVSGGGTKYTVEYAQKRNRKIIIINPAEVKACEQ